MPASLVRFARTRRFRGTAAAMAAAAGQDDAEFTAGLLSGLAALANAIGGDLGDADWARLLDALLLVTAHPSADGK
jgi:hypothetical protein